MFAGDAQLGLHEHVYGSTSSVSGASKAQACPAQSPISKTGFNAVSGLHTNQLYHRAGYIICFRAIELGRSKFHPSYGRYIWTSCPWRENSLDRPAGVRNNPQPRRD